MNFVVQTTMEKLTAANILQLTLARFRIQLLAIVRRFPQYIYAFPRPSFRILNNNKEKQSNRTFYVC